MMRTGTKEDVLTIYSISVGLEGKQKKKKNVTMRPATPLTDRMKMFSQGTFLVVKQVPTEILSADLGGFSLIFWVLE